ncbi:uncharacterized protein LOC141652526 [Silene latifolia]|uniref:uncharacterized protein LOC141652526 n=1 Tax=Silene latifolia TaxID=37657 RepID=UPI003D787F24
MLISTKIKPIDGGEETAASAVAVPKPVMKSRLKRLFRIPPPHAPPTTAVHPAAEMFEPSSVCLAKMVTNFIEENNNNNEKHGVRNRCNCFNGNGSDGSDGEADAADIGDFLKSLVVCATVNERNVVADTARVVAEKNNKVFKRKDELRKLVVEGLMAVGYDAAICKSKWEKSPSFPAGEYEYVDVIVEGERLIIDIDFRSEFEVARSTKIYKSILQTLPNIFVGKSDRLAKIICIISEAAKQSLKKKGMHIPPWRKADYVQAKWLSPPTRLITATATAMSPPTPVDSITISNGPVPNKPAPALSTILAEPHHSDESETSSNSCQSETVFDMSGDEDVKGGPEAKKSSKIVTGLASLIENKP